VRFLAPVLIAAVIAIAAIVAIVRVTRASRARADREELRRHEEFLHRLHRQAIKDSPVDPTSAALADEIGNHLANKEI
jgi:hypothetical protein